MLATMMRYVVAASVGLSLSGCAGFLRWSDPGVQAVSCAITSAVLPLLEEIAATWGIPLEAVEKAYSVACGEAAARGLTQHDAESYGVSHARAAAMRMAQEAGR